MPSRSKNGKGKASLRRGRTYRSQRSASRRRNNAFDSENSLMSRELADKEKKKEGELNAPVKGDDIFVSKSLKAVMNFGKKQKKEGHVEKNYKGSKKRRALELQEEAKKSNTKKMDATTNKTKELTELETQHTPQVVAAIKKTHEELSQLTRKKQKSKLFFKMKRDKAKLKKLKTQLVVVTALDKGKKKRKSDESKEGSDEIKVLDDEAEDILEEEDILDVDQDDEEQDQYDEVAFGEQVQEPPKKLAKLSAKLEKRIETEKIKRKTATKQEQLQERQKEILRQKVIENYKRNRLERMTRRSKGESEDTELNALRRFAANKSLHSPF